MGSRDYRAAGTAVRGRLVNHAAVWRTAAGKNIPVARPKKIATSTQSTAIAAAPAPVCLPQRYCAAAVVLTAIAGVAMMTSQSRTEGLGSESRAIAKKSHANVAAVVPAASTDSDADLRLRRSVHAEADSVTTAFPTTDMGAV